MTELDGFGDSAWVPMPVYLKFIQAVWAEAGSSTAYIQFWRAHIQGYLDSALLAGLVGTARKLFGLSPVAIYKVAPRGYGMTYRGAGQGEVEVVGKTATLRFSGIPAALLEDEVWAIGHVGTFWGVLDVFNLNGTAEMTERSPERGRFTIQVKWS